MDYFINDNRLSIQQILAAFIGFTGISFLTLNSNPPSNT
jgi:hypothetical protein